jgi:phage-related protein
MADDINLPNLVSHLAVNLDGMSGAIADASRQGSSMGAALGGGVQRELQGLLAHVPEIQLDGNSTELDRDLARVRGELEELANQRIGVDVSIDEALRRIGELTPHLQRLGDQHPDINVSVSARGTARQLNDILAAARRVDGQDVDIDVNVDTDRPNQLNGILGRLAGAGARAGASIATGFAKGGAAIGAVVPLVAGVVSTLAQVAPAAGVAVTGMAAVQLASGAVKLAAVGMEKALTAALDPSKAAQFSEALDKLSPSAQRFATVVRDLAPALRETQQAVQEEVFRGLGDQLQRTATSVLPILRTNLLGAGTALHDMASGALDAGTELADSGTLGQALGSASQGLRNLSGIPGVVVTALGQIAAAAGPSFEALTEGASGVAERIGERLGAAFESGAMQDAIERAVDLLGQLRDVGENVFDIIGSIFNAVPAGGGGMVAVLQDVTAAIADVMNTADVQDGLRSLFETMGTIGATVAPLLAQALLAVAPVVSALGPPIQTLVTVLGDALGPIIEALGPVLQAVAVALGQLIVAVSPLLTVFGDLITALLPVVLPLFQALGEVFAEIAPVLQELADALLGALAPILAQMPTYVQPFADILVMLAQTILPIVADLFVQLAPSLATLGQAFGQLLVAAAPIMEAFGQLVGLLLEALMPIIQPLIGLIASLAGILASLLAGTITNVVVPVLEFVAKLLTGDFSGAWQMAKDGVGNAASWIGEKATAIGKWIGDGVGAAIGWLKGLPGRAGSALANLAASLVAPAVRAGTQMVSSINKKISEAVAWVKGLPGRASAALGDLNRTLIDAGRRLIQGFINGISEKVGAVKSTLSDLTGKLTDWKGPAKKDAKILTPAGRLLIEGFIKGIDGTTAKLRSRLESITKALPDNVRSGYGKTLKRATAELEKLVTKRDGVIKKLAAGQKKLDDLVKARTKASSDITKGILDEATITTGRADVNSVSAITVGLQQALKDTKAFQANIAQLQKAGIRSDLLQQIADAGVSAGGATAAALAKATPAELKRINDLQAQLAKSATSTGNTVGDALYLAGINAAKGLVAGLKSQEKAIEAQMTRIAKGMITTTKKVHRAKSPARAFYDIGVMDGEGLRGGLLSMAARVRDAAQSMAGAALDVASGTVGSLAGTPSASQLAAVYAGGSGGDTTNNFHLYGSEASPDGILRALSWQGLVGRR